MEPNRKVRGTKPGSKDVAEAKASEALPVEKAVDLISVDEYIERCKPPIGLVASFKYEAEKTEKGLAPRAEDEWKEAFEAQAKRIYPSFQ